MDLVRKVFPYEVIRTNQGDLTESICRNYSRFDVFIINAPVAFGKMGLAKAIMNLANHHGHTANWVHPDNVLVKQGLKEFPDLTTINWRRSYSSEKLFNIAKAKVNTAPQSTMNYYTLLANRVYKDVLIIDEAHTVFDMLQGMSGVHIWETAPEFEYGIYDLTDLLLHLHPLNTPTAIKWKKELKKHPNKYVIYYENELLRGVSRDRIKLVPLTVRDRPPILWPPGKTKKIFLMSATISRKDIEELGLHHRRVCYLEGESEIPFENRPFYYRPIMKVGQSNLHQYVPLLARHILNFHNTATGKGLVHTTYGIASRLKPHLKEIEGILFHTRHNKQDVLGRFLQASDRETLIGSGMTQGINLKYDLANRQTISKCPFPNKGQHAIAEKAELDPEWYAWVTIREILQAYGRVCRAPDDYGETEMLDGMFMYLWKYYPHLFPKWFDITI